MSILINESYANPTTALWGLANDVSQWATYPAVGKVDLAGQTVLNGEDVYMTALHNTNEFFPLNVVCPLFFDLTLISVNNGNQNGLGMDMSMAGNLSQNSCIADTTCGAPQIDYNISNGIGVFSGFTGDIGGGVIQDLFEDAFYPAFNQTDLSQQSFRINMVFNLKIPSGTTGTFGVYISSRYPYYDYTTNGNIYSGFGAYKYLNLANYYDDGDQIWVNDTITDIINYEGALNVDNDGPRPTGFQAGGSLQFYFYFIPISGDMTINTSNMTFFMEPLLYFPTQQ